MARSQRRAACALRPTHEIRTRLDLLVGNVQAPEVAALAVLPPRGGLIATRLIPGSKTCIHVLVGLRYRARLPTLWEQANFGWMALHNCWELGLAPEVCKVVRFEVYLVVTRSIFGTDLIFF